MMEHESEPVRGLPGELPKGEEILWQGAPDWRVFARSALFTRWIAIYFTILTVIAFSGGSMGGGVMTMLGGAIAVGLLCLFAVGVAKTTVYTITDKRVVLRIGVALNKCINLPLKLITAAELRGHTAGYGDIALSLKGPTRLGYAMLWPHARPFRLSQPQPMLRAIPDSARVAKILADACDAVARVHRGELDDGQAQSSGALEGATA